MIEKLRISGAQSGERSSPVRPTETTGSASFGELLRHRAETVGAESTAAEVALSKHAASRAEQRGIDLSEHLMARLSESIALANTKGVRNMLVLDETSAFIVDVPQSRVVTALSKEELKDNLFTNIDGAVLLK